MPGGVQASLGWLREHLAEKDRTSLPEQIILTGTPLGLYPVGAGDHVVIRIDGKIGVECAVL
jgi:2-keto-4-pentenoate hydratase/2-oxohepta-3-ene-1,7-dioic acid hydratase in catechol pathway